MSNQAVFSDTYHGIAPNVNYSVKS